MINEEKIIELITDDDISNEDLSLLNDIADKESHIKKLIFINSKLSESVNLMEPGIDLISEFVLYKNKLHPNPAIFQKMHFKIERHIANCEKCNKHYLELSNEYKRVNETVERITNNESDNLASVSQSSFAKFNKLIYSFSAAAVVVVLLLLADVMMQTPVIQHVESLNVEYNYLTRNINNSDYIEAITAINNKDYQTAVNFYEKYLSELNQDEMSFYDQFSMGKLYFLSAKSSFIGLFESFDKSKIDISIKHFKKSLELNNNPKFRNISYDTMYFLGICYSIIDQNDKALGYLSQVIDDNGKYSEKAEDLKNLLK